MKKKILFISLPLLLFLCLVRPVMAGHLDGLWRNDRLQITLRIEEDAYGFRAKRTDEGIWYHYTTEDNRYFLDKKGNWYELIDNEELVWNEAKSDKRIKFLRVDHRDYNPWDSRGNGYNEQDNGYRNAWHDDHYFNHNYIPEGIWYQRNGRGKIQIETFRGGIRMKTDHRGWEKFYGDQTGNRFRDDDGDTIFLLDDDTLRLRNDHGKCEEIYTRHGHWDRDRREWRD